MEAASLPAPRELPGRRVAGLRALGVPAWILLVVAVLLGRHSGVPVWDTVWAEDATVFLQGALDQGPFAALAEPYAGYLHVPVRLLAELVVLFPAGQWAIVLAVGSAAVTAALSLFVFAASASVLESVWARGLAAALPIMVGVGWEAAGAICNLHWFGLYAAFWAVMTRPESRRGLAAAAVVAVGVALSDPLVALLLPLALLQARALGGSRARRLAILGPLAAALALQAVATLTGEGPERFSSFEVTDVAAIYGQRVAGGALLGDAWFQGLWHAWGWTAVWGALEVAVVLVALAGYLTRGRRRGLVLAAAGASVLYVVGPLILRGTAELAPQVSASAGAPEGLVAGSGSRYMLFPAVALLLCLVAALDARGGARARAAFTAVVVVVAVSNVGLATVRTQGPGWTEGLADARIACTAGAIDPYVLTPPEGVVRWGVRVPCERLGRR